MSSLRAAVLVFVVGASIVNYFFTKEQNDEIAAPISVATSAPTTLEDRYLHSSTPDPGTLRRVHTEENDNGWVREAIIVTIAGIAWFALRARTA
jgi:hypothetical protein